MRKISLFLSLIFLAFYTSVDAQDVMRVHNSDNVIYQQQVGNIDSLKLIDSISKFYPNTGLFSLPIAGIDSITFANQMGGEIYIIYNGSQATIINPFSNEGVTITDNAGHVTATSTYPNADLKYNILGGTSDGSLNLTSEKPIRVIMSQANITNPSGAAISLNGSTVTTMYLSSGTVNTLNDGSASTESAALYSKKNLTIAGNGALNINGFVKHGIKVDATLTIESGIINIPQAASDGINVKDYTQNGGNISIIPTSDGIDVSNTLALNGGELYINSSSEDVKGLKATTVSITGGTHSITVDGVQSKAIKSSGNTIIDGGSTLLIASGYVFLEPSGSGYDPSYCTGIKSDVDVIINGGNLDILCLKTNLGGKGISVDGNISINGGTVNISTMGDGANYTNDAGAKDSYTAACMKADGNILLLQGDITCTSSGKGGKGISADGTLTIGNAGADDDLLNLKVTTHGDRFLVSGSGQNADYANPKAIKSEGDMTVNSGIITVSCTQSTEGGEGLESKSTMYIKGGRITGSTYDDCINAAKHIEVSGGKHSLTARGNDGMDSNGTLTISGGMVISKGAGGPEEGFDCDNNTFKVLGGIIVGTGGNSSNPTANVSTQNSLKLSIAANQNICIRDASNRVILMYALPPLQGGGPGPGGNNKMVMLFSDPAFVNGNYTIEYGGTITGGSEFNGYYTGAEYSGGSSRTFTVSAKLTNLNL